MSAERFGRYLLLETLAEGGMGRVYRAELRSGSGFSKQVALKRVLKALSNDSDFVRRFADEARIASTLSHSNIVQVFDFGAVDGDHYLAMEYVDGIDLGTLLDAAAARGQTIPVTAALHICAAACRGLGAAHDRTDERHRPQPVVHRDVSPQNVLISRTGEVKVADFGIAKAADKVVQTRTGLVVGKCRYMAPEQAAGDQVTPAADTFAAGIVLFEMLTGRPLFDGDSPESVLRQVISAPVPTPSSLSQDVPPEVDELVAIALQREVSERFATGTRMARELEQLLHRVAPEFSRDDVAALVAELVPRSDERQLSRDTVPGADTVKEQPAEGAVDDRGPAMAGGTLAGGVDAWAPTAPGSASPTAASDAPAVAGGERTTASYGARTSAQAESFASADTAATTEPRALAGPARGQPLFSRASRAIRLSISLALACAAGALGGGIAGWTAAAPPAEDTVRRFDGGGAVDVGGCTLRLRGVRRGLAPDGSPRLVIDLVVDGGQSSPGALGRHVALSAAGQRRSAPRFWVATGRQLQLTFAPRSAEPPLRLLVALPTAEPVALALPPPG